MDSSVTKSRPSEQAIDEQNVQLQNVTRAHIDSFNYFLRDGIHKIVKYIEPVQFLLGADNLGPNRPRVSLSIVKATIAAPKVPTANRYAENRKVYPSECRERRTTYAGEVEVVLSYTFNNKSGSFQKVVGTLPIMVKSDACNIANAKPSFLVSKGEEPEEMGGYFIVGGNEKVVRLLIQQRRNYPLCLCRSSWKNRGREYTEYGVSIRCVREDQTANALTLHYLQGGTAKLSFGLNKEVFFVPIMLILKAMLKDVSDVFIYNKLVRGKEDDTFYKGCVLFMQRQMLSEGLTSQLAVLKYIGKKFRVKLSLPPWYSDEQCGRYLLKNSICIHLDNNTDKFNLLVYMTRKLFAFVNGECATENPDNPMFQELLLPGHLIQMVLKEKLEYCLLSLKSVLLQQTRKAGPGLQLTIADIRQASAKCSITRAMEYLLATGNLISKTGLGLMQTRGFAIIADKLNFYRYISHFRAVHRGAFFTEMRTTAVRKLLPEAWGFLCPVHTPDGTPCGLLNHMAASCNVVNVDSSSEKLESVLLELGLCPVDSPSPWPAAETYTVLLDGRVLGWLSAWQAPSVASTLRVLKVKGKGKVPPTLEVCLVPKTEVGSQYPGLYLFTSVARMVRPVLNLKEKAIEMIGTFEQVYLDIAVCDAEAFPGMTSHQELSEQSMLSILAYMTPFSDFNQSPRNMYQCQMGKQTMGTPLHAYEHRADNKLYRLQTPQSPLVRTRMYDTYKLDEYPLGTNTCVAVISYTGYDMEDAMILNKSAFERGFGHGSIIKSEVVDLRSVSSEHGRHAFVFECIPSETTGSLDRDGLPHVGAKLTAGDPYYCYKNINTGDYRVVNYKGSEDATVEQIKVLGDDLGAEPLNHVCFVLRVARNPTIGDKFSSRHGQKGICSMLWPVENMPFAESGMVPDILFNPHGFPSRMTIGMMIESMAGKAGALFGMRLDATPFTFSEDQPAGEYFGDMLTAGGYNYFGTERLYSGITGQEMEADIYFGIVYYQRLRHMVSDKFQVRTTGPVDSLTQQPVKGRKRMGGVRFGEMERDGLIAHGSSFLLQDRLFNCSDKSKVHICGECQTILSPILVQQAEEGSGEGGGAPKFRHQVVCQHCKKRESIHQVSVPYVFRYLTAELASVGIKTNLTITPNV